MGICGSSLSEEERKALAEQRKLNKQIEEDQQRQKRNDDAVKKLLLLGAGESGKSTLFKQMITLYGKGYPESERKTYKPIVIQNCVGAMKILIRYADEMGAEFGAEIQNTEAADRLRDSVASAELSPEEAADIKALWEDPGIQIIFENRAKFQFPDSGPYFFGRVDAMIEDDYIPSEQDVLRSRVRTTGIVETTFEIDGNTFRMFDVGGQRNERKKWIHCFENVTSVIFVGAISEYDQMLFEDEETNRMVEALNLFDEICNSRWFVNTSIILFLNKRDLFAEKIKKVPLGDYFDDYLGGPHDYDAACDFLREKFEERNRNQEKEIYTHITCATDSNNISHVFNAVKDIIIKQSLRDGGLM